MRISISSSARSLCHAGGVLALLSLAACGGGTTSDDELSISGITQSATTVDCGAAAYATASVSYDGDVTASDIDYSWVQSSGTSVSLSSSDTSKVYFTAPSSAGTVVLKLTVSTDSLSDSESVSFTVSGSSCS
ncbi:PKD domain-containing protein [Uliginosibacterium aquaticum]|uniref:Ig-like domain-containing protein n=1 Tax=Uliginosibacterium aquaticum TaxID=2731212 RepID=A0ABX2IMM3_9RHOO|nr:hypothetical protein [Uliginosibacterium aquaticum]NSL55380.1 hypothetical protein [Uliginosibacterium aquaticum]